MTNHLFLFLIDPIIAVLIAVWLYRKLRTKPDVPAEAEPFKVRMTHNGKSMAYAKLQYWNGKWWIDVVTCHEPFLNSMDRDYELRPRLYALNANSNFDGIINQFKSIDEIKAYEAVEKEKFLEGNRRQQQRRDEYYGVRKDVLKKYGN